MTPENWQTVFDFILDHNDTGLTFVELRGLVNGVGLPIDEGFSEKMLAAGFVVFEEYDRLYAWKDANGIEYQWQSVQMTLPGMDET